jgi:hypothetical protein
VSSDAALELARMVASRDVVTAPLAVAVGLSLITQVRTI